MRVCVLAAMLAQLALVAHASAVTVGAPMPVQLAPKDVAVVADDWAAPAQADKALLRRAIKQSLEDEKAIAAAQSKEKAIAQRYTASSQPDIDKYEKFAETFDDAKVPGCLRGDGLKRQSTFIFNKLLALPFIAVAAVRGKCN